MKPNLFRNFFRLKCSLGSCATYIEIMVSISFLGFEKFASQSEKLAHVTKSAKKNIGATACRAWARAETFNGLQEVLQILCVPGPITLITYPVSDEDILVKELKR